jgi:hypothetical protein
MSIPPIKELRVAEKLAEMSRKPRDGRGLARLIISDSERG